MRRASFCAELEHLSNVPLLVRDWDKDCGLFLDGKTPGCMPLYGFEFCRAPKDPLGPFRREAYQK
jgi:hypothetical protein